MRNTNGNGLPRGLPPELAEALGLAAQQMTPAQKREQAKQAFDHIVGMAVEGCPGGKEDEEHRLRDESLVTFLKTSFNVDVLPDNISEAVVRLVALQATHSDMGLTPVFDNPAFMPTVLLAAGVTLKVLERAQLQGVRQSTGTYL